MTNEKRVKAVEKALAAMPSYDKRDRDCNLIDLLANIRHYCDDNGLEFGHLDRIAYEHYLEEKAK